MNAATIYILNILLVALPLAIFEIIIEKDKGWGSGWSKHIWYAKPFAPRGRVVRFVVRALHIEPPLNYHFAVFGVLLPFVFILEYFYVSNNILLLLACFVGVIVFEDLLWFLLNWYFDSFKQLLKGPHGDIWWHKRWVHISRKYYLPASYFTAIPLSIILFILNNCL